MIQNTGTGNLFIPEAPSITGGGGAFYLAKHVAGFVGPGESVSLRVGFNPDALGVVGATLDIPNNDLGIPAFTVALTGEGVAGSLGVVEAELGTPIAGTPGTAAPEVAAAAVNYDPASHTGSFSGLLRMSNGANGSIGVGSHRVTDRSGVGSVSSTFTIGRTRILVSGTVNPDGSITPTRLSTGFAMSNFQVVETAGGAVRYTGVLTNQTSGDVYDFSLVPKGYDRSNPPPSEGVYTLVIPANESLGAGPPSGDSVGTATVSSAGDIRASIAMADGASLSLSGFVDADDRWSFFKNSREDTLSGTVVFRDVASVSDLDGSVIWNRAANSRARSFHEGFSLEGLMLGSLWVDPGQALLAGLTQNGLANVELSLTSNFDPLTGAPATQLGPFDFIWADTNRTTYVPTTAELVRWSPTARTGTARGSYSNNATRERYTIKNVVFQKQNLVLGNYYGTTGTGRSVVVPKP